MGLSEDKPCHLIFNVALSNRTLDTRSSHVDLSRRLFGTDNNFSGVGTK
jgi:hypothetical protein